MLRTPSPAVQIRWIARTKPFVFAICLLPAVALVYAAFTDGLGADPIEKLTHTTGDWTLRFLMITLAVTPLRQLTGWHTLIRLRRMLGLYAFFYAVLHFSVYIVLDQFFAWTFIVEDIAERPYILVGFTAFLLLLPLAVTSTNAMVRRLGGRRWQRLHRLVYAIAVLGVLHFLWLVKADVSEPAIYAMILTFLLGYRLWKRRAGPQPSPLTSSAKANL